MRMEWALDKTGALVHIKMVPSGISDCRCPGCGDPLIAKKGDHTRHHFAHMSGAECSEGGEGPRHKLAKSILERVTCLQLPKAEKVINFKKLSLPPKMLRFELGSVKPEILFKGEQNIRVDELIVSNGYHLAVEIMVTHKTDIEKARILAKRRLDCLEIFIEDDKEITPAYITHIAPRKWIYNNQMADLILQERRGHTSASNFFEPVQITFDENKIQLLLNDYLSLSKRPSITEGEKHRSRFYLQHDKEKAGSIFNCDLSIVYAILYLNRHTFGSVSEAINYLNQRGFIKKCALSDNSSYHEYVKKRDGVEMSAFRVVGKIFNEIRG